MISLKDLHDATLTRLELDWKEGELLLELKTGVPESAIVQLLAGEYPTLFAPGNFLGAKADLST